MRAKKINITQSLIKDLTDYIHGKQCGLVLEAKYIHKKDLGSGDLQNLGHWFEYCATKAKTKFGKVPQPVYLKDGVTLSAKYAMMKERAKDVKRFFENYGLVIVKTGKKITAEGCEGTIDVEARTTHELIITDEERGTETAIAPDTLVFVDIKTSGLLNDGWNEMGWKKEYLDQKEKLMLQPVHYKWLGKKKYKTDIPFFFLLFSNTNEVDCKIYLVKVDEEKIEAHANIVKNVKQRLAMIMKTGFVAHPSVERCADCALKDGCEYFTDIPKIETVYY